MENNEKHSNDGFGKGIILILIGVVALMVTFFEFEIDWDVIADMWPVLLIIIGVCIMPVNRWIRLIAAVVLLAFGYAAYCYKANVVEKRPSKIEMIKTIVVDDYDYDDD